MFHNRVFYYIVNIKQLVRVARSSPTYPLVRVLLSSCSVGDTVRQVSRLRLSILTASDTVLRHQRGHTSRYAVTAIRRRYIVVEHATRDDTFEEV